MTRTTIALALITVAFTSAPKAARATLPHEQPVFKIADFVNQGVDCVARSSYSGQTPTLCDLAPAFQAAVLACEASVTSWAGDKDVACNIEGMPGLFYWGSTVDICHTISIDLKNAKIFSAAGVSPFKFLGYGACESAGRPKAGSSKLSNAYIRPYASSSSVTRGVTIHAPVKLEHVHIIGYTQGVYIHANADTSQPLGDRANANAWSLEDVTVQSSLHAGIWVDGPDANVGLALRTGSTTNCQNGSALQGTLGTCADIFDGSFLGSTWIDAHTGYAKDTTTNAVFPGLVMGDSNNSRSVCVGCYVESGYGDATVATNANVLGGIGTWTGGGNALQGNRVSGLESVGSDGLISIRLGSLTHHSAAADNILAGSRLCRASSARSQWRAAIP